MLRESSNREIAIEIRSYYCRNTGVRFHYQKLLMPVIHVIAIHLPQSTPPTKSKPIGVVVQIKPEFDELSFDTWDSVP